MRELFNFVPIPESQAIMASIDPKNSAAELTVPFGGLFHFDRFKEMEDRGYEHAVGLTGHVRLGERFYQTEIAILKPDFLQKIGAKVLRRVEPNTSIAVWLSYDKVLTAEEFSIKEELQATPSLPIEEDV